METRIYDENQIRIRRIWDESTREAVYRINVKGCLVILSENAYAQMLMKLVGGELTR